MAKKKFTRKNANEANDSNLKSSDKKKTYKAFNPKSYDQKRTYKDSNSKSYDQKRTYKDSNSKSYDQKKSDQNIVRKNSFKQRRPKNNDPLQTSGMVRLNKFIAQCGMCSRRKADELIAEGMVKINGHVVHELGKLIDPKKDSIKLGNKVIQTETQKVYYMFNKPTGVITSLDDPEERPSIKDYFSQIKERVFPVGRLDWDTEGLILLTNDGEFSHEVMHPSKKIPKTYLAKLDGHISNEKLAKLKNGVTIPGGRVQALHVEKIKRGADKYDWVKIVITEGKNHQVKHMFQKVGFDVKKLQRVAIGTLSLGKLKRGEFAPLTYSQIMKIFKISEQNFKAEKPNTFQSNKPSVKHKQNQKKKAQKTLSKKDFFKQVRRKSRQNAEDES